MSHYTTLGIPKDADETAIKDAYRRKSREMHPDRPGGDHVAMIAINLAYETLSDSAKRKRYDETGQCSPELSMDDRSRTVIMQLFAQCMENSTDQMDLIDLVRKQIEQNRARMRGELDELKRKAARAESARKRLKHTGDGRNFLDDLLAQKSYEFSAKVSVVEQGISLCDRSMEMLVDFKYEVDTQEILATSNWSPYVFVKLT